jgi:cyclin-dependent kinase
LLGAAEYDEGVDVWAAGCVIAEMALGKPLFRGNSELAMIHSIFQLMGTPKQADYPDISKMQYYSPTFPKFDPIAFSIDGITKEGEDFLRKLLVVNPKKRLTVEDALRHEFLCD